MLVSAPRPITTVHHFPGSGGTIFSKALAAMDDVVVLSEIHPDRHMGGRFHALVQLRDGYRELLDDSDRERIDAHFMDEIGVAYEIASKHGCDLVVRDHIYRDFLETDRFRSRLIDLLETCFAPQKLVSVRDPVDCYLSHRSSHKGRKGRRSPDVFCERYLRFVDAFPDAFFVRYEDFVEAPARILQGLCAHLGFRFNAGFADRIAQFEHFTGDGGRSGTEIASRPRRPVSTGIARAFEASGSYVAICERFGYAPISSSETLSAVAA